MKTLIKVSKTALLKLMLALVFIAISAFSSLSAQVTFIEKAVVTDEALFFWKADDPKPYHYGAAINPHGNCVKVVNGFVFYTWYKGGFADRTLMVSRKKIGEGAWVHVALPGKLSLVGGKGDTHLTTNIGVCPIDGTVHIMYDHHNEDLNYIVSKKNIAFAPAAEFIAVNFLPQRDYFVPGVKVTGVTYPKLINNDQGEMFFERRLGSAVGGDMMISFYNGNTWSSEFKVLQGTGAAVSQGERNYAYGKPYLFNGNFYYVYSVRWAESPTEANEGVYMVNLGPRMNQSGTTLKGKSYSLPIIDHKPFLIADPRSVPDEFGWAGGPNAAVSPKDDIYLRVTPKGTSGFTYLRRDGEAEFKNYGNAGAVGDFYGNRMYRISLNGGSISVQSCLAGSFEWRTDYTLNTGIDVQKSQVEMENGKIVAVFAEKKASDKVPIHCYVFNIEKSEYQAQSITFNALPNKMEGDANFNLTATASSNLPVKYTSSNTNIARIVEGNKVQIVGVGTCNIIAKQAGNGTFDAAPEVVQALTVTANTAKTNQTIQFTLATPNFVWGTADETLNAVASSGLQVQYESSDTAVAVIVAGKLKVKRAGKAFISALQPGNSSFNAAPIVSRELNVPKRTQVITFADIPEKFSGDAEFNLQVSSNNPNAKLRFVCPNNQAAIVWNNIVRHLLGPGSATITVSDEGDDYFTSAQASKTLVVKAKTHVLPKLIEAEHFTTKNGTDVTRWSNSIFYLNTFAPGDWAEYTIDVPADGNYTIEVRTAAPTANSKLNIVSGTTTLSTITLTSSPSLTVFRSNSVTVPLSKGVQKIRVVGVAGSLNFDYLKISSGGGTVTPPIDDPDVDPMPYTIVSVDAQQVPNVATNLFDGNASDDSRWSAQVFPKSVVIDLGAESNIIGTRLYAYQNRAYKYKVELSDEPNTGFFQIVDRTNNTTTSKPIVNDFPVQIGRYVKLTITGVHNSTSDWASVNEFVLMYEDEGGETSVKNISELTDWVGVYPNPANSSFKVRLKGVDSAKVQIYTLNGQLVYNDLVSDKAISLSTGVYVVKAIGSNQKLYREKLIVK